MIILSMKTSPSSSQKPNKLVLQPIKACKTFEHFQLGCIRVIPGFPTRPIIIWPYYGTIEIIQISLLWSGHDRPGIIYGPEYDQPGIILWVWWQSMIDLFLYGRETRECKFWPHKSRTSPWNSLFILITSVFCPLSPMYDITAVHPVSFVLSYSLINN